MVPEVKTDFLVIGVGPAGSALACFLGQNGMKGIMITDAPGTTDTPRAHLVNPFALECLRDIELEDDAMRMSMSPESIGAFRYCGSLLGREWGNLQMWEGKPENATRIKKYTPSRWVDFPQSYMEPILVKYAYLHGFAVRYSTQLETAEKDSTTGEWLCTVNDRVREDAYIIRTKYLFGADGGRSPVARSTKAEFSDMPSAGVACNILFKADLTHLMGQRYAQLHTVINPDSKHKLGVAPIIRVIRPWHDWMLVTFTPGVTEDPFRKFKVDDPEILASIRELVGLDEHAATKDIPIQVTRIDGWVVRETVAKNYLPDDNVFLVGDAAHRHPPAYGLGSNTCIQDAYNLAWKVAFVAKGLAGPALLQTYNAERQPVGAQLVRETNAILAGHFAVWDALGALSPDPKKNAEDHACLRQAGEAGEAQREKLHQAFDLKGKEGTSFGLCGNQWYVSDAIYLDDEAAARPKFEQDPIEELQVCTYPGSRLPHAWLDNPERRKLVSTHDLAGKGAFCLFTGYGGDAWQEAAKKISKSTGIPISSYKIGFGLEWQDIYREWYSRRGVDDSGCVLVRPDRYVAWRSVKVDEDCEGKLSKVLDKILSRG